MLGSTCDLSFCFLEATCSQSFNSHSHLEQWKKETVQLQWSIVDLDPEILKQKRKQGVWKEWHAKHEGGVGGVLHSCGVYILEDIKSQPESVRLCAIKSKTFKHCHAPTKMRGVRWPYRSTLSTKQWKYGSASTSLSCIRAYTYHALLHG